MDYHVGLERVTLWRKPQRQARNQYLPLHSPLLRESWLVSIVALR